MLWKQEVKQLLRTPLRTLAVCLALAIVTGLLSITYGLQLAVERMRGQVEAAYTTVGYIPTTPSQFLVSAGGTKNVISTSRHPLFRAIEDGEFQSEIAFSVDTHSRLAAYDLSLTPLLSGEATDVTYSEEMNFPNNFGVFAVTCREVRLSGTKQVMVRSASTGRYGLEKRNLYYSILDVEQVLSFHPDFNTPTQLIVETIAFTFANGSSAIEEGESYLIWGYYDEKTEGRGRLLTHLDRKTLNLTPAIDRWESDRTLYIHTPSENEQFAFRQLPLLTAYSGSAEEYLQADPTGMWRVLMETAAISSVALQVCSADHPNALRAFIDERSVLLEGSFFSEAELASGAKVAMISDLLAEKNGIEVGDTLDLSFYHTDWSNHYQAGSHVIYTKNLTVPTDIYGMNINDYEEYREFSDKAQPASAENGSYTVVGIYSVDAWVDDVDNLHPNTVIVPQAALSTTYELDVTQLDRTIILPNGSIDAFEEELTEAGYGGMVHYYDQGYSTVIPGVEAIAHSAAFVYRVAKVLWILSVLMVLLLFTWMQMPTGRVKYRLGSGKRRIWGQMSFRAFGVLLLSCVGGFAASVLLYDRAIAWMMQADFTSFNTTFSTQSSNAEMLEQLFGMLGQSPRLFAESCAVQFGILLVIAVVFAAVASLRKKSFRQ